jgi:glycosyltransferase involved in cell wall biosynthesis
LSYTALLRNPLSYLKSFRANQWATAFSKMLETLKNTKDKHYHLIVHTPREADTLRTLYDIGHVTDYPYNQLSKEEIKDIKNTHARTALLKRFKLSDNDKLIGCFGFITRYKGIDTAIKALSNLPPEYKLLIFGTAHPNHIALHKAIDPYMNELIQLINDPKLNLSERVLFGGKTNNQEFTAAIHGCDFVVLPYLETGQTSSGPTTMALELSKKIVATNNHFFNEVATYAPNAFLQFDIGNYTHLAQLIRNFPDNLTSSALETYNEQYSIEKRATTYWQAYKKMLSHSSSQNS